MVALLFTSLCLTGPYAPPQSGRFSPKFDNALKLHGRPSADLRSLGEPKTSGGDRGKAVRQVPGTHLIYAWEFKDVVGPTAYDTKRVLVQAAVGDESGKVDAIRVELKCSPSAPQVDRLRPSISQVIKSLNLKGAPELYYVYDGHVMAKFTTGKQTTVICGDSMFGPPVVETSKTDFATGEKSTTILRSPQFSLERTRVFMVFIGEENENHWNVFDNSLLSGYHPLPTVTGK